MRGPRCNNLSFTLEGISLYDPCHWTSKNFTEVEGPWILDGFVSYPLMHICVTSGSNMVAISCLRGPISIMFSYSESVWKRQTVKFPSKFWHFACADHYGLGHYRHYFVYAVYYENYAHFAFGNSLLPPGPRHLQAQSNPLHLSTNISNSKVWHKEKGNNKALQMCWCPSHHVLGFYCCEQTLTPWPRQVL